MILSLTMLQCNREDNIRKHFWLPSNSFFYSHTIVLYFSQFLMSSVLQRRQTCNISSGQKSYTKIKNNNTILLASRWTKSWKHEPFRRQTDKPQTDNTISKHRRTLSDSQLDLKMNWCTNDRLSNNKDILKTNYNNEIWEDFAEIEQQQFPSISPTRVKQLAFQKLLNDKSCNKKAHQLVGQCETRCHSSHSECRI